MTLQKRKRTSYSLGQRDTARAPPARAAARTSLGPCSVATTLERLRSSLKSWNVIFAPLTHSNSSLPKPVGTSRPAPWGLAGTQSPSSHSCPKLAQTPLGKSHGRTCRACCRTRLACLLARPLVRARCRKAQVTAAPLGRKRATAPSSVATPSERTFTQSFFFYSFVGRYLTEQTDSDEAVSCIGGHPPAWSAEQPPL